MYQLHFNSCQIYFLALSINKYQKNYKTFSVCVSISQEQQKIQSGYETSVKGAKLNYPSDWFIASVSWTNAECFSSESQINAVTYLCVSWGFKPNKLTLHINLALNNIRCHGLSICCCQAHRRGQIYKYKFNNEKVKINHLSGPDTMQQKLIEYKKFLLNVIKIQKQSDIWGKNTFISSGESISLIYKVIALISSETL